MHFHSSPSLFAPLPLPLVILLTSVDAFDADYSAYGYTAPRLEQ